MSKITFHPATGRLVLLTSRQTDKQFKKKWIVHASFGFTELSASDTASFKSSIQGDASITPGPDFALLNTSFPTSRPSTRDIAEHAMAIPATVPPLSEPLVVLDVVEADSAGDPNASRAIKISSLDAKH